MGTIIFEGEEPFELIPQQQPTSRCAGDSVEVILPVFSAGSLRDEVRIQLVLTPDQAEYIARQLVPVVAAARANARLK
ncbi:MAG: hypothetical protein WBQ53_17890 [Methylocystis sp.]